MQQGIFISFEGIDGAGKSSHITKLSEILQENAHAVLLSREPGGTPLAEKLRSVILNDPMDALTETLLVFAARRDHLRQIIEPALQNGKIVLCDRFTDATFAYQGFGRGFDIQILNTLECIVQNIETLGREIYPKDRSKLRQPDITFLFDITPEKAMARLNKARAPDKFESLSIDFFERVRKGYLSRQQAQPERFITIDADQSIQDVWLEIVAAFRTHQKLLHLDLKF